MLALSCFYPLCISAASDTQDVYFIPLEQQQAFQYFKSAGLKTITKVSYSVDQVVSGTNTFSCVGGSCRIDKGSISPSSDFRIVLTETTSGYSPTPRFLYCKAESNGSFTCGANSGSGSTVYAPELALKGILQQGDDYAYLNFSGSTNLTVSDTGTLTYQYEIPWFKFEYDYLDHYTSNTRVAFYPDDAFVYVSFAYYGTYGMGSNPRQLPYLNLYPGYDDMKFESELVYSGTESSGYRIATFKITCTDFADRPTGSLTWWPWLPCGNCSAVGLATKIYPLYLGRGDNLGDDFANFIGLNGAIKGAIVDGTPESQGQANDLLNKNESLDSVINDYDSIEQGYQDNVKNSLSAIDPGSSIVWTADILTTFGFVSDKVTQIYDFMGGFKILIMFSLVLGLALLLIGVDAKK